MTDKVINALKCISGEEVYCEECSYSALYRYNFCIKRCAKDAIELINRFKRQCNKYRNKVQTQAGELRRLYKQNADYKAEIQELKEQLEAVKDYLHPLPFKTVFDERIEREKTEAIKDFAERLKKLPSVLNCESEWMCLDIDNLVKEMVGDVE